MHPALGTVLSYNPVPSDMEQDPIEDHVVTYAQQLDGLLQSMSWRPDSLHRAELLLLITAGNNLI